MSVDPTRIPVIVGVGEINDRPASGEDGMDPIELMAAALNAADQDAGGGFLNRCDRVLVVPQISFRKLDTPGLLADRIGLPRSRVVQAEQASGDTPVHHLNDAANAIASGEARVVMGTGGEALRTAAQRAAKAGAQNELFKQSRESADLRVRYGLIAPSEIYSLYENATRAAWGQSLSEAQAESGQMWSVMSRVAETADGAWLKQARTPKEIVEPSADNRLIAFPFTKFMVANASVNQGAAFVVTSLSAAREAGVGEERLIYIGAGAAAHESENPLERADWNIPPGMRVSLQRALALNGLGTEDIDHLELYSCFPCVPKMARRVLGWPADRAVTVHGGLTFGGGPIGNYMAHAIASMVRELRRRGRHGLLFANGGHCTHNHTIVLSRMQPKENAFPRSYDFQAEADAMRGNIPRLTDEYVGGSRIETYTVVYDRTGAPAYGVVLSRTPSGERVISRVDKDDGTAIAFLTDGRREVVGAEAVTARRGDTLHFQHDSLP